MSLSDSKAILQDERVGVRLKISALWVTTLFLFAYGDIFAFFVRGRIEDVIKGEVSGIEITQTFLFAVSAYIAIASAMVYLTMVLRPSITRWLNIVLPCLYVASIIASVIGEASAYFLFLSGVESILLLVIAWTAWNWPRRDPTATE